MSTQNTVLIIVAVTALAAALLAWFAIDVGTTTLRKYRAEFTEKAQFQAREFFLFIDPRKLFAVNLATMALGAMAVWLFTDSWWLSLLIVGALAFMPRVLYAWMKARRLKQFEEQLPDALMMLGGSLRAGAGLNNALQQLVAQSQPPLSQEFSLMLREQRLGVTMESSLANLSRRVPSATCTLVVSAMRIATETGGGLAETLERTSQTIRGRMQMEGKINALTAQGKMQAWVVGGLPVMLMLVLNNMEPEGMSYLWNTQIGWATLCVLAFLEVMGIYLIRKITTIDV
jgi:tight adherence protein B